MGAKDPVAAAFALPKGVTLTPAQQTAYRRPEAEV